MTTFTALDDLVSPYGVISATLDTTTAQEPDQVPFGKASIGSGNPGLGAHRDRHVAGGGRAWGSPEKARFLAIAESAERYAGSDLLGEHRIWATPGELAGDCLEFSRFPRCAESEYAHPACPVRRPDPGAPIRWVRGLDLASGQMTWVPAAMACYGLRDAVPAEDFVFRISTGYAVHTDPVEALVRGICEVAERDMISVVWLQRLPLPVLAPADHSETVRALVELRRRSFVEPYLFDATSELGVPTVYCVLAADHDPRARRTVGAGTGRTLAQAAESALYEAVSILGLIRDKEPNDPTAFTSLEDGAIYMGAAERASAFDFLLDRPEMPVSSGRMPLPDDPDLALAGLVSTLSREGMRTVAVDRTTRELADVGLTAVSVVIPDLQPMCPNPMAQFKAHPRLYRAPARMGYRVLAEEELNPWPQPFP
ncbi:YcaO-like family protein [Nonomuraea sp. NPDC050536]|uniref:YcaO-like family protein n=1 Tax=Nonomuraea sp. NPDC050536 TaxID=3364366 RepID=UPI0037C74F44